MLSFLPCPFFFREPVWDETFIVDMPPVERTKLELTVWDHDLGGFGNDFWGRAELNLRDVELPLIVKDRFLESLYDKKGNQLKEADANQGAIQATVHTQRGLGGDGTCNQYGPPRWHARSSLRQWVLC